MKKQKVLWLFFVVYFLVLGPPFYGKGKYLHSKLRRNGKIWSRVNGVCEDLFLSGKQAAANLK